MAVSDVNLTRGQIMEIVGNDLRKVRVFEALIAGAVIQDDIDSDTGIRITRWANGRMEQYPVSPAASAGGTVTFPLQFIDDTDLNITHGMYRAAGISDDQFTVTVLSETAFTWVAAVSAVHMWRAIGRWK